MRKVSLVLSSTVDGRPVNLSVGKRSDKTGLRPRYIKGEAYQAQLYHRVSRQRFPIRPHPISYQDSVFTPYGHEEQAVMIRIMRFAGRDKMGSSGQSCDANNHPIDRIAIKYNDKHLIFINHFIYLCVHNMNW